MKKKILTACVLISLIFTVPLFSENKQLGEGCLKGRNIVMVVPERLFHETTFDWLNEIFIREGAKVIIASSNLSGAYGAGGLNVKPAVLIKDILVDDIEVLVFIGGAGCLQYLTDYTAHKIAKQTLDQGKLLVAIHQAPRILAEAGLLNGKKVTCNSSAKSYLKDKGAVVTDNDIERDGNILTAVGPSAVKELGEAIVSALCK